MPRQILTPSRARRLLEQYRAGDLTQAAFCQKHNVSSSLFVYWLPKDQASANRVQSTFQEVCLPPSPAFPLQCVLTLSSGARLEFPASQLPAALAILAGGTAPC
jgi:hypothetical protein